jgi:cellulose synthase/poly-beta-1,6-N-acetylglucosamine synthase-like glycosyltransferase
MVILVLAALGALYAIVQVALAVRTARTVPVFSTIEAPTPTAWPRLSLVVPARNEAFGIEEALRSKLACDYPEKEIVLVDDRSTDATGTIAASFAAHEPRLKIARIVELPPGWLGKVHAMSVGVDRASGEWLLFSDADVHIEPGTLQKLIAHAEADQIDMVAMMPRMDPVSPLVDACVMGLMRLITLTGRLSEANRDGSTVGVGVGAFNLVRRSALRRSPGLSHLRMEIVDDVALGAMLKASGARCRFYAARKAVHLVFAESLSVFARGLEKGGGIFGFSLVRTLVTPALGVVLDLGIPLVALASGGLPALFGAVQLALVTATFVLIARLFDGSRRGALLWPLGIVVGMAMLVRSGVLAWWRKAIVWRGTYYTQREIESGRRWIHGRVRLDA